MRTRVTVTRYSKLCVFCANTLYKWGLEQTKIFQIQWKSVAHGTAGGVSFLSNTVRECVCVCVFVSVWAPFNE
jgi:hypothetical protein